MPDSPDLDRWLDGQPDATALARTWEAAGRAVPDLPAVDVEAARARLFERLDAAEALLLSRRAADRAPQRLAVRRRAGALAAVAVLAVAVVAGVGAWRGQTLSAEAGSSVLAVALPDGSDVSLSPGSRIEWRRAFSTRDVALSGEAFFDVARDPTHPFTVTAGAARVTVLGTRFAIRSWDAGETSVVVEEGRVRVADAAGQSVVLTAGLRAVVRAGGPLRAVPADVAAATAWRRAAFAVYDVPLGAVAVQVERAYGTPIRLARGVDAQERVTALLPRADRAEAVLGDLAATLGYRVVVRDSDLLLTP